MERPFTTEIVKILIQNKEININLKGGLFRVTALHLASFFGHKNILEILIEHDEIDFEQKDNYGQTALNWAFYYGRKELIDILKEKSPHLSHSDLDSQVLGRYFNLFFY